MLKTVGSKALALIFSTILIIQMGYTQKANAAVGADPKASVSIEKISDGSGHGTKAQTFINSNNGYSPGDNTPTDGVVASNDTVQYRTTVDIAASKERDITVAYKLPKYLEYKSEQNSGINVASNLLKKSPQMRVNGNTITLQMTAKRGVAVSFNFDIFLNAKDTGGKAVGGQVVNLLTVPIS